MATFFHLTPTANLPAIMREGLVPQIGARARRLGEPRAAVYLFASMQDLEHALTNWLNDEFDEDEPLALISVALPPNIRARHTAFEAQVVAVIPTSALRVVSRDFGA